MLFFLIFLYCCICALILMSIGFIINSKLLKLSDGNDFIENSLFGIVFISFISLLLNFFTSLNQFINSLSILFVIYFFTQINFEQFKKAFLCSLIIALIAFITFIFDHSNRPDSGLYHLPYVSILNEHKIIFGSANLHWRFGNVSILQYFSAIFNNFIFGENGILMPLAILYGIFISFFLFNTFNKKNLNYIKILSFLFLAYILSSMNRYSGFGNDAPSHMFYFLIVFYFINEIQHVEKTKIFNKILYFSLFTFLIKSFFAIVALLPLSLIFYYYKKIIFINRVVLFCSFFLFLWLLKNVIVSSCLIYPINFTCFNNLEWSTKNSTEIATESEAWAKDWPNRIDKNKDYKSYLSDYNWIKVWSKNHSKVMFKKIFPQIIILVILFFVFLKNNSREVKTINKKLILISLFLSLLFSIIWFIKFPLYRFGESFLVSSVSLFFIYIFYNKIIIKNNFADKTILTLTLTLCLIVFSKNVIRIIDNFAINYVDKPWPKKNSFSILNEKNSNIPVKKDGIVLYYRPYPNELCHYSQSPCTHEINLKVNKKNLLNYTMYYKN